MDSSTDPATQALSWQQVTKKFGDQTAVDNLSLDIPYGSFYGIVGPNGAGKTTAITIAAGLLRPDAGTVFIGGHDIWGTGTKQAKATFGLLADGLPVFDRLSGREYLDYLGRLRGLEEKLITDRSEGLLSALGLEAAGDKMIVDYSAGMTKKILLAGALLHKPSMLVLDEPLEAVDPVSARVIKDILAKFVHGGGTVMMSSHVMEVVEGICDHVALIADGQVRAAGTLDQVRQGASLAEAFVSLVGGGEISGDTLDWLDIPATGETVGEDR